MLDNIFGSIARTKLLKFFCVHSEGKFFIRELARNLDLQINSVRRELNHLEDFGLLNSLEENGKKYYCTNLDFNLFKEIKNLVFKVIGLEETVIANKMSKISGLQMLLFTGVLTKSPAHTDVLIVGKVNKNNFIKHLSKIADGFIEPLRYTFLSKLDYLYRLDIVDKFIYDIWSNENIVIIDKISKQLRKKNLNDFSFKHFR